MKPVFTVLFSDFTDPHASFEAILLKKLQDEVRASLIPAAHNNNQPGSGCRVFKALKDNNVLVFLDQTHSCPFYRGSSVEIMAVAQNMHFFTVAESVSSIDISIFYTVS